VKHFITMFLVVVGALFVAQLIKLARWPFRLAFVLVCILGYFLLDGCATPPHAPPVGIWEGGVRLPDNLACSVRVVSPEITVLEPCPKVPQ
jgi:hypothetical protein